MTLNTATEARVHFTESIREVRLSRGEALFEVAKDRARPFVVQVGGTAIRAVGTAFAVRVADTGIDVTVTEGIVQVVPAVQAQATAPQPLAANQRATVTKDRPIEIQTIKPEYLERRLAWRQGMVAFNGESLAEAVAEINRHNRRHIVVVDPQLAVQPVIGMFRANDIGAFARTAAAVVNARAIDDGEVIRLESYAAQ